MRWYRFNKFIANKQMFPLFIRTDSGNFNCWKASKNGDILPQNKCSVGTLTSELLNAISFHSRKGSWTSPDCFHLMKLRRSPFILFVMFSPGNTGLYMNEIVEFDKLSWQKLNKWKNEVTLHSDMQQNEQNAQV